MVFPGSVVLALHVLNDSNARASMSLVNLTCSPRRCSPLLFAPLRILNGTGISDPYVRRPLHDFDG